MNRFRFDNTESYTRADLKLLNHRCNRALRKCKHSEEKSVQERIAERVQTAFDTERARWRGPSGAGRVFGVHHDCERSMEVSAAAINLGDCKKLGDLCKSMP